MISDYNGNHQMSGKWYALMLAFGMIMLLTLNPFLILFGMVVWLILMIMIKDYDLNNVSLGLIMSIYIIGLNRGWGDTGKVMYMLYKYAVLPAYFFVFMLLISKIFNKITLLIYFRVILMVLYFLVILVYWSYYSSVGDFIIYSSSDVYYLGHMAHNVDGFWHVIAPFYFLLIFYAGRIGVDKYWWIMYIIGIPFLIASGSRSLLVVVILVLIYYRPIALLAFIFIWIISQYIMSFEIVEFYVDRFILFADIGENEGRFIKSEYFFQHLHKVNLISSDLRMDKSFHNYFMDAMGFNGYFGFLICLWVLVYFMYKYSRIHGAILYLITVVIAMMLAIPSGSPDGLMFYIMFAYGVYVHDKALQNNIRPSFFIAD